jgi:hypothetical protein
VKLDERFVIVADDVNRFTVAFPGVDNVLKKKLQPVIGSVPSIGVQDTLQVLAVISDTVSPVGAAGKVVTTRCADSNESPVTELFVLAVNVYLVFEAAPVNAAGLALNVSGVGPEGLTVKIVERVPGPAPPVQVILKLLLVAVGRGETVSTGVVGPVV